MGDFRAILDSSDAGEVGESGGGTWTQGEERDLRGGGARSAQVRGKSETANRLSHSDQYSPRPRSTPAARRRIAALSRRFIAAKQSSLARQGSNFKLNSKQGPRVALSFDHHTLPPPVVLSSSLSRIPTLHFPLRRIFGKSIKRNRSQRCKSIHLHDQASLTQETTRRSARRVCQPRRPNWRIERICARSAEFRPVELAHSRSIPSVPLIPRTQSSYLLLQRAEISSSAKVCVDPEKFSPSTAADPSAFLQ